MYNAFASIPLHSLLEADDELSGLDSESEPEREIESFTRASSELDSVDDDVLMMSPGPARQPEFTFTADEFADLNDLELEAGALRNAESADMIFIPPSSEFEPLDIFNDHEGEHYHP